MRFTNRLVFYSCLALCTIPNLFGQLPEFSNPYIDSLKQQVDFVSDSAKVDLLNQIAYNYYYYYHDSTESYAKIAIELADSLGYKKGLSEALRMMGIAAQADNNDVEAMEWLFNGLETAQSINYHQGIADNLNSIGILYNSIEDHSQAISFFKRSVVHQKIANNKLREGILYTNIAAIYRTTNELDSSLYYFQKSKFILDSIGDEKWIAMVYSQFGGLWIKLKDLKKATSYSKKAMEISLRTGQTLHLRKTYQNFAEIYLEQKRYSLAQKMADKALKASNEIGFIPFLIEAYGIEYQIKARQEQYKTALFYHEKYSAYKDSLRFDQKRNEANLIRHQMELDQKENENLILRKEKETQDAQIIANNAIIQRQTVLGVGIVITLILVSIVAFVFFRLRLKERVANTKLSKSNRELEEQKEELSATLQMVEHLNAQLQAQNKTLNKTAIVSITDLEGNIISVNENFCDVTGYTRDELLGNDHSIIKSGEHSNLEMKEMWKTIIEGNTWRGEFKNKNKNGEFYWVNAAISAIFDDSGKPKQFFSLQFDITKRKNYLDQLAAKSQELEDLNKLKDKLLSVVSHDFRSPLNSLRGTLTLFLKGAISNEELNMLTKDLVEKLDNTYNLLENLLNWAKSQMQGMKVYARKIDLKMISKDCVDLLFPVAEKKHIKIVNNIIKPIAAFADNEMVKLLFRNLMSNAIKFTITGNEIILDANQGKDFVTISVKDNGTGISNENQEKLFKLESFSTRGTSNESGMGLGLMLCKDFVQRNGGKIWFESELGKGSIFYFTLPVKEIIDRKNINPFL